MALKLPLVISGDASSATAALGQTDAALAKAAKEAERLSQAMAKTDQSIARVAAAQTAAQRETAATKAAFAAGSITVEEYNRRLLETKTSLSLVEAGHRSTVTALKQAQTALGGSTVSAGQAQAGYVNLGRQMQDVAVQLQGGANIGTIIAQQGGQVADAVAQMGGKFAGFASFMAGPWGAAIIVGVGALINLIPALLDTGDAADEATNKSYDFSKGLEVLQLSAGNTAAAMKQLANEMRSAIAVQGNFLQVKALVANQSAKDIAGKIDANQGEISRIVSRASGIGSLVPFSASADLTRLARLRKETAELAASYRDAGAAAADANIASSQARIIESLDKKAAATGKYERAVAALNQRLRESQASGDPLAAAANPNYLSQAEYDRQFRALTAQKNAEYESAKKPKGAKKVADRTGALANFSGDEASKIAGIKAQFSDLPSEVKKSEQALRQLDDILADIGRKKGLKPEVATALRNEIAATRTVINESLNKPFSEYLEKAQQAVQIDQLLVQGKYAQAEALQIVLGLEQKQAPLSKEQLATVLATVEADRARSLVLRDQQAIMQGQVRAVQDVRGALEETVADALRGKFSIGKVLSSLGNSYIQLTSQKLVESLFGNTLRSLEEQASGSSGVKRASDEIARSLKAGEVAVTSFADVVTQVRNQLAGGSSVGSSGGQSFGDLTSMLSLGLTDLSTSISDTIADIDRMTGTRSDGQDIVVTAARSGQGSSGPADRARNLDISGTGSFIVGATSGLLRDIGIKLPPALGDALSKSLTKLEKGLPQALAGAFTGASASRILLGDRGTGGTIGAAIGGALGGSKVVEKAISGTLGKTLGGIAGPLGSIVGGLLGGLIGGLFAVKPRGSGTVTQGSVNVSANKDSVKDGLNTLGGNLQNAVQTIADRLGGVVGNYEVGIGQYKDYYQVSNSGSDPNLGKSNYQKKSSQALYDGKDAAAALSAAIANAVTDGAIVGISAQVAAALKSSSDIDKALREAFKVQDVELALGGVGEVLRRQVRAFENQASERLKIAAKYGFDVVALEKRNAEDRIKLTEKLLKSQVGSIQQLIDDLTAGSLFEGSAIDQRAALQGQIAKARADTNAGVEGAADTLSALLQQFNTVSKDAFGTTGGFAADRQAILDIARDSIAKANQRVTEAQKVTDPALAVTNAQLNESNDQLARIAASMNISVDLLRQMQARAASSGFDLSVLKGAARI